VGSYKEIGAVIEVSS